LGHLVVRGPQEGGEKNTPLATDSRRVREKGKTRGEPPKKGKSNNRGGQAQKELDWQWGNDKRKMGNSKKPQKKRQNKIQNQDWLNGGGKWVEGGKTERPSRIREKVGKKKELKTGRGTPEGFISW